MSDRKPSAAALRAVAKLLKQRSVSRATDLWELAAIIDAEYAPVVQKAAAHDRLIAWLDSLEIVGVAGRFIAPREIREVLEEKA